MNEHHDPSGQDEPIDASVRSLLRGAAVERPRRVDPRDELALLRPRFERARRRREAGVAGSMLAAAAIVAVVVMSTAGGGEQNTQQIDVAGSDGRPTTTVERAAGTSTSVPATAASSTIAPAPSTSAPDSVSTSTPGVVPEVPGSAPVTRPPTLPTVPPTAPPTTVPTEPTTQVVSADGGTATIRWDASSVTVVSTAPAVGWSLEEIKQESATRVVVKFRRDGGGSGSSSSTIDVRVLDGRLRVDS